MTKARSNGKHAGGRPSKYEASYPQKLLRCIRRGGPRIFKPIVLSEGNHHGSRIVDHPLGKLPGRFERFMELVGISDATFERWTREREEFRKAYEKAKAIQRRQLLEGLQARVYEPAGAIFDLKNNHGYRDRQPDESSHVNVTVSITMIETLKTVAQHQPTRLDAALHDNGYPDA